MANKLQVLALAKAHPDWPCQSIAAEIGASREYVYTTLRRAGITPVFKREVTDSVEKLRERAAIMRAKADSLDARADRLAARPTTGDADDRT